MGISEKFLHQRIWYVHARENAGATQPARPASALAQLPGTVHQPHLLGDEAQSLLARSAQCLRDLEKRNHLHVVGQLTQSLDLFDVDETARDETGERFARYHGQSA